MSTLVHPKYTIAQAPAFVYASSLVGTDHIVGSDAVNQGGYAAAINEATLAESDDARDAHFARVDSFYQIGTYDGVEMVGSYQSGSMRLATEITANTHFTGFSACQALGRCASPQRAGSACSLVRENAGHAPTNGFCYESAAGTLECGRTVETWGHFGAGVATAVNADGPAHPCPRGTPNTNGAATGTIITASRVPLAGCMISTDASYLANAEVHVPQMCTTPAHYMPGCLFPGANNFAPGAKESARCYYETAGCTSLTALNYNPEATTDDGSCIARVEGCTLGGPDATNNVYHGVATGTPSYQSLYHDDSAYMGPGRHRVPLPNHAAVTNFNPAANVNVGCTIAIEGCMDASAANYDPQATVESMTWCVPAMQGCMNPSALNYDPAVTQHVGSMCHFTWGCMEPAAFNYNSAADHPATCYMPIQGCLDISATNYGCQYTGDGLASGRDAMCMIEAEPFAGAAGSQYGVSVSSDGVTVHLASRCYWAGYAVVASRGSVADLLAASEAGAPGAGDTGQIIVTYSLTVAGNPCDIASNTGMLDSMRTAFAANAELPESAVTIEIANLPAGGCGGRRLSEADDGTIIDVAYQVPTAQAAALETAVQSTFASAAAVNAMLASADPNTVFPAATSAPVRSVSFYSPPVEDDEMSAGAIVGIIIGCLVGVALIAAVVMFMMKKQTKTSEVVPA